jgi:phage terminase large subunit GpA-like protein
VTQATPRAEPGRYVRGLEALRAALAEARRENLKPPPRLTLSQWAARYAVLSRETSAQT